MDILLNTINNDEQPLNWLIQMNAINSGQK